MISRKQPVSLVPLAQELKKEKNVRFAYIYGSVLTRADAGDIDIAVYLGKKTDYWSAAQKIALRLEKRAGFSRKLDVHTLNGATPAFAFEVMKKGRLLFERGGETRLVWEAHMLSRYQDIRPMLEFHDRRYISR